MRRTRFTPSELADARQLFERGDKLIDIAQATPLSPASIRFHARSSGWRRPAHMRRKRPTRDEWARGEALWDAGKTAQEVGRVLGVTPEAVYSHARNHHWSGKMSITATRNLTRAEQIQAWRCMECDPIRLCTPAERCDHIQPWETT